MNQWTHAKAQPVVGWRAGCVWALVAVIAFQAAHVWTVGWLTIPCAYALVELSRLPARRSVWYTVLMCGFLFYAPQLGFFWKIFGPGAAALWYVLAFWIALFAMLLRLVHNRFGEQWMLVLAPVLWTGFEYFRGELYYLRFTWLTFGMAHGDPAVAHGLGVYFLGFLAMALASGVKAICKIGPAVTIGTLGTQVLLAGFLSPKTTRSGKPETGGLTVAGVQLEFAEHNVLSCLDQLVAKFPDAQLLMLSEYTFDGPIPEPVRNWCRKHHRYLVAGGKETLGTTGYYNMAYVVDREGEIVHRQVKSVPIQFFQDGLPAPERKVWNSPWGPIGILICYDLSYTRVVDDFVRQGARALLVPTMDVINWGAHQHELHSRIAPMRAAEYGIPIFRVCSSGISQIATARGGIAASAPFPGQEEMLGGSFSMGGNAALPLDRTLAPLAVAPTGLVVLALLWHTWRDKRARRAATIPASSRRR